MISCFTGAWLRRCVRRETSLQTRLSHTGFGRTDGTGGGAACRRPFALRVFSEDMVNGEAAGALVHSPAWARWAGAGALESASPLLTPLARVLEREHDRLQVGERPILPEDPHSPASVSGRRIPRASRRRRTSASSCSTSSPRRR